MANVFDQFDTAAEDSNVFDQFDLAPSVKPGDVEARKKQVAAQAAGEKPNVARERLGNFSAVNPMNVLSAFGNELAGGIKDTALGAYDLLTTNPLQGPETPATDVKSAIGNVASSPLGRTALGAVRVAASPFAGLADLASEGGEVMHKFLSNLGLETGADVGAGITQTLLDVGLPLRSMQELKKIPTTNLQSPRQKAAALRTQLADSEAAANTQIASARERIRQAPREAEEAVAARQSQADAARESVESIAEAGAREVPSAESIRQRFAKDAPLGQDVGQSFKDTYTASRKAKAKEFNDAYDEALAGTADIESKAEGYKAAIDDVLGEKGVSRPLPTQAERVANKARGALDVSEDVADQLAALEDATKNAPNALAKQYADDALAEFIKGNPLPDNPTVRELVLERQRIKAAMRIASQTKNDNLYRQFAKLEKGIANDIPDAVRTGLAEVDARYLNEFVPFYGKRSTTRAIAEGSPEKVVSNIIRPASDAKAVEKVSRAWELMDDAGRENTRKAFVNKGVEDAMVDGAFDAKKFTGWWKKHSDPTGSGDKVLKTVFGKDYGDMKSVVNQLQTANRLSIDDVAAQLTKGFQQSAAADIKGIQANAKNVIKQGREEISSAKTAQALMKQQLEKQIKAVLPEGSKVATRLESIGSGIVASGAVGSLIGSPSALSRVVAGNMLILSSKGLGALLSSARGRAPLKAVLRATPGTSQAAAAARQAQNVLQSL